MEKECENLFPASISEHEKWYVFQECLNLKIMCECLSFRCVFYSSAERFDGRINFHIQVHGSHNA